MRLSPQPHAPFPVAAEVTTEGLRILAPGGESHHYDLCDRGQAAWLDVHEAMARDLDLRKPAARRPFKALAGGVRYQPILTAPLAPEILYGYGDPAVIRWGEDYVLTVTSNDAPDAFPILTSRDLTNWRLSGFVFPQGCAPAWALTGENQADFWAPEMHRVGDEAWVVFTARKQDRSLAIGLAKAATPAGPFVANAAPLVEGGVIDAHIMRGPGGAPHLVWKEDRNDVWPALLAGLLHQRADAIASLFPEPRDQRIASLAAVLHPWLEDLEPMERFFALQPLIEAVAEDFTGFATRLAACAGAEAVHSALHTRILAQPLAPDGSRLEGEPTVILQNDQPWEAHLIEGVWALQHQGRSWIFYAGNDFATPNYGIGAAVADHPLGPYRKAPAPILASSADWWGPGHPSVAEGPDGRLHLFLHAFFPGHAGYKAFRALLSAPLTFEGDQVRAG